LGAGLGRPAPRTTVGAHRQGLERWPVDLLEQLATGLFGPSTPFISIWLIAATGVPISVSFFVMASEAVSFAAVLPLKETAYARLH
jgi:hypothetical protein